MNTEISIPNPEFLIKSIAEQGYTLETSIADLIDNSISASAKNVEVLIDTLAHPFKLFIADDGSGMSEKELQKNMEFPSSSPEASRSPEDLGRFGLGLKTASFAQSRCFTVISKKTEDKKYHARTWNVDHLKTSGKWEIIVNSEEEIADFISEYSRLSTGFLNSFERYIPNTIVIWHGLYKFEKHMPLQEQSKTLQAELTQTTKEHLQLIFHRFLEKSEAFRIRINNDLLSPFNPFPDNARQISTKQKILLADKLKLEGFVLPQRSIAENRNGISGWALTGRSLMDMEGMYIYRADRIIFFGGWNGMIPKSSRLQLARLRVEIGNGIDHLFHLNVAKSSIIIPFGEQYGFKKYLIELKKEAEKEYYNFEIRHAKDKSSGKSIFKKTPTNHGVAIKMDEDFPLLKNLVDTLNDKQIQQLNVIFRIVTTEVNRIKKVHTDENYAVLIEEKQFHENDLLSTVKLLLANGISKTNIKNELIPAMGINLQTIPDSILSLLK
ncbi:ATP-binding protein [Chitinophagaceae bacterium MMS25-I14]